MQFVSKEELLMVYVDNFNGLGCFVQNVNFELINEGASCIRAARRIPLAIRTEVRAQLEQMEETGIITKMNEPSDWVSNLTVVEKKQTKKLRLCIDPQELNANLKDDNYLMPTISEITAKLAGKKWFTVLYLKDGYWQVKLNEKTSKLCTFSTPFGNYRYVRMPFGIKIAAQIFQKYNERNFGNIQGVAVYIDDLLIAADSEEEHD